MTTQHILLTALGKEKRCTVYELHGSTVEEPLAPLALLRLLPQEARPNRVLALCTNVAKKTTWPTLADGVRTILGIEAEPLDIPDGRTEDEIRQIVEIAAAAFPEGVKLTLDLTHGYRNIPFITYALALYLKSLHGIEIRGAYYGMVEGVTPGEPCPIVDLKPLLELPEWFHAVRVFRETGSTGPLAGLISPLAEVLRSEAKAAGDSRDLHQIAGNATKMRDGLNQFSFAYESGMPLELGKAATLLAESVRKLPLAVTNRLPLSGGLAKLLQSELDPMAFASAPKWSGKWKTKVAIDEPELSRQATLIQSYFNRNQLPLAAGLLREWVVSWLLNRYGKSARWWSRDERKPVEQRLGALQAALATDVGPLLSDEQREWAQFWKNLSDLRNTIHHHGMREDALEAAPPTVAEIQDFWNRIKDGTTELPSLGGGRGTLLITSIGNSPGVLYSALLLAPPDRLLVLCSPQSESMIAEATHNAEYKGESVRIVVNDPYKGFGELPRIRNEAERSLFDADCVIANLTGGTTLMGLMIQQLVEASGRFSRPSRRFALIDQRPRAEQEAQPWVKSDSHWLDKPEGDDHADN